MDASSLPALAVAVTVFAVVPGPAVLSCATYSMAHGLRAASLLSLGIVLGDLFYLILAILGFGAIAESSSLLLVAVKWLGGAYLVWLGYSTWMKGPADLSSSDAPTTAARRALLAGLSVSLPNPKVILFYLALLPTVVDLRSLSILGVSSVVATVAFCLLLVNFVYSSLGARAKRLAGRPRAEAAVRATSAVVLACAGLLVATR